MQTEAEILISNVLKSDKSKEETLELIKKIQIACSRKDFYSFRLYMHPDLKKGWFQQDVADHLQEFYEDFINGKKPKLVIEAPPQHGKSTQIVDFIAWLLGKSPDTKTIYTSFSERLGIRANLSLQRMLSSQKYKDMFPDTIIPEKNYVTISNQKQRNREIIELVNHEGCFRNTTVEGSITGESLDLGIIDDPIRGRKDANSLTKRDSIWNWFTDDFFTRFSEDGAMIAILTRWHVDDPIGRFIKVNPDVKCLKYPALSEKNVELMPQDPREEGSEEALFPEHKSKEFLLERKTTMADDSWASLYQQNPYVKGGGLIKSDWFQVISKSALPFNPDVQASKMIIDGAFTNKTENDETATLSYYMHQGTLYVYQCDGVRLELNEYLEHFNRHFVVWGGKPNTELWIEKKASGNSIGSMLGSWNYGNHNVNYVPNKYVSDGKLTRVQSCTPFMSSGKVVLVDGSWIKSFLDQLEAFPNGSHDDKVDVLMYAILKEFMDEMTQSGVSYGQY